MNMTPEQFAILLVAYGDACIRSYRATNESVRFSQGRAIKDELSAAKRVMKAAGFAIDDVSLDQILNS